LNKRTLSVAAVIIILTSMLRYSIEIEPVKATNTIYIRANGSVDHPSAPVSSVDNVTYILTGNITCDAAGIVVERDHIIINGDGYTLTGPRTSDSEGIDLSFRCNVTVCNMTIREFGSGILLAKGWPSGENIVSNNTIVNNIRYGILVESHSVHNILANNSLIANGYGILSERDNVVLKNVAVNNSVGINVGWNCVVSDNMVRESDEGITVQMDGNIIESNFVSNSFVGICLRGQSSNNTIQRNILSINTQGIHVGASCSPDPCPCVYNRILGNNITNSNGCGICIQDSNYIEISQNWVCDNEDGIVLIGTNDSVVENNIACTNAETGSYLSGVGVELYLSTSNTISSNVFAMNSNAGILVYKSDSNLIERNHVFLNNFTGIFVLEANYNTISDNDIRDNFPHFSLGARGGIFFSSSNNNTVRCNEISHNDFGIYLYNSNGNRVFHNNFIDNLQQVHVEGLNTWDDGYPSGGNYWSDYSGSDFFNGPYQNLTGSDGIIDTPYVIDGNNQDNYPFMTLTPTPLIPWDITGPVMWFPDGKCDIRDVAIVALRFGSNFGEDMYDVRADITGPTYLVPDGKIDIRDIALVAIHFGEEYS